ncbi:MAG: MFS transporter [Sediminibacterium sp.]|nr:MFS transporter [Sediminibacterium sp.]
MNRYTSTLVLACLVGFAYSTNYTNHAPLAAILMKEFLFTKAQAGLLTSAIFFTHALMQIPGGHLADKLGGKRVMLAGLTIITIGNFLMANATSYSILLACKFFIGFGTGVTFIAGARFVAQTASPNELAKHQGWYGASILLGSGFVIFAIPLLAGLFHWSGAFAITAGFALLAAVLLFFGAPDPAPVPHPPVQLNSLLKNPDLWKLGFLQMASFGLVIVIGSWINELLKLNVGMNPKEAGAVGSIVLLLGIFTRLYGAKMMQQFGFRKLVIGSMMLNVAGCLILSFPETNLAASIVAILFLGVGCGLPFAGIFTKAGLLFPGRAGAAMGLVNMLGIIMILVGAPLLGKLADVTGNFRIAFLALGAFAALGVVVSFWIKEK